MRALWMLVVVFVGVVSFPQASAVEREGVTPFETEDRATSSCAVLLNGRGPFRFLLDTGSTHNRRSPRDSRGDRRTGRCETVMGSAAGSRETLVVRIDALDVGPITVAGSARVGRGARVGLPAWRASTVSSVTMRSRRFATRSTSASDGSCGGRVTTRRGARQCTRTAVEPRALPVALPQRQSLLRLVPDTGAESLLLFDPASHAAGHAAAGTGHADDDVWRDRGAAGDGFVSCTSAALTLRDVPAVVAERDRSEPVEVDGLLPLHFFDRVTFDGPGKGA